MKKLMVATFTSSLAGHQAANSRKEAPMVRVKKYALAAGMLIVLQGSICLTVAAQQPLLQITSPADGAVVNSDQTITVLVSADPSIHDLMVFTDYRLKVGGSPSPKKFLLTIPATVPPG